MIKPPINENVAQRERPFECVSGMISSLMTNNIAPAAKPIAKGKIGSNAVTIVMPNNPPIGSTKPVNVAMPTAFHLL